MVAQVMFGTLIHGTTRPEDLIPAFQSELSEVDPVRYANLLVKWGPELQKKVLSKWILKNPEDAMELLTDLADALSDIAMSQMGPECYFGTLEGDGSDWGYWTQKDENEEHLKD